MSLILEALKKSEAERRLGQAPGLLTPAPRARRSRGVLPAVAAVVLALALGASLSWWLLRPDAATPAVIGTAAQPATGAAAGATAPAPATGTATDGATRPPPARPAPAVAAPADPAFRSVERESAPVPAGGALPLPAAPPPDDAVPAPAQAAPPARRVDPAAPAPVPAEPAATPPAAASAAAPAPDAPEAAEDLPDAPPLRTLPRELREALPPLHLSMHVFNADPAARFVLIDGRRYGEGMAIAEELLLEAIRRDGVILVFRGQRFFLPRPG